MACSTAARTGNWAKVETCAYICVCVCVRYLCVRFFRADRDVLGEGEDIGIHACGM